MQIKGEAGSFPFIITHYSLSQWGIQDRSSRCVVTSHLHSGAMRKKCTHTHLLACAQLRLSALMWLQNPALGMVLPTVYWFFPHQ